jgi:hypothetical protein
VSGDLRSNVAAARVIVSGGVFTTDACVVGVIFADRNGNGLQDAGEPGVPDVALHFEEGTSLISDLEGKYSYCGLTPTTQSSRSIEHAAGRRQLIDEAAIAMRRRRQPLRRSEVGEVHRTDFIVEQREPGAR